jgi:hypothetical protein
VGTEPSEGIAAEMEIVASAAFEAFAVFQESLVVGTETWEAELGAMFLLERLVGSSIEGNEVVATLESSH